MWSSLIYGTWLGGRILGKPIMRAVAMVAATIGAWLYGQWPCDMGSTCSGMMKLMKMVLSSIAFAFWVNDGVDCDKSMAHLVS